MKLESFLGEIQQEAFDIANNSEHGGCLRLSAVTAAILERLADTGLLPDAQMAYHTSESGNAVVEVHAYAYDSEEDVLHLFFCIEANEDTAFAESTDVKTIQKQQVERAFGRLERFVKLAQNGKLRKIEESQPAYELVELVREAPSVKRDIALHVITTGKVTEKAAVFEDKNGLPRDVWDIVRLSRVCKGSADDQLAIDFVTEFGESLPCLVTEQSKDGVQVLFTFIKGTILAKIYNTYRTRLLERNVRSFLQFTGKVNKGIRDTVLNEPTRFLPYNNGLSATASSANLDNNKDGLARLLSVHDFQIVNGGQTTATLAMVERRDGADLAQVVVAMKLTLVPPEKVNELVPRISRYANTQNRIQEADFDANHPWHIALERLSRDVWTAPTAQAPRGTRWFYERSRGQYADGLSAQGTPAGRKKFRAENPSKQKFTKTDLAKYRLTWDQRPEIVSRGAQKCFAQFMQNLTREKRSEPDETEFKRLIALAILFKKAESLYGEMHFSGYRANVVTFALARLSHELQSKLPYEEIWSKQSVPEQLVNALKLLLTGVRQEIVDKRPSGANISEWSKKNQCWDAVLKREFDLGLETKKFWSAISASSEQSHNDQAPIIAAVKEIPSDVWFAVANWGKDTESLYPVQRKIAFDIGKVISNRRLPSLKQSQSGKKLILRARELGFVHAKLSTELLASLSEFVEE
jgi:hypothetical protein